MDEWLRLAELGRSERGGRLQLPLPAQRPLDRISLLRDTERKLAESK